MSDVLHERVRHDLWLYNPRSTFDIRVYDIAARNVGSMGMEFACTVCTENVGVIAASIQVVDQGDKFDDLRQYEYDFDVGIDLVGRIAKHALKKGFPDGVDVLNVNIPRTTSLDTEIEITRLSRKVFKTAVEKRHDPRGRPYYWINDDLVQDDEPGTDVHALAQHHISVTPLTLDSTVGLD